MKNALIEAIKNATDAAISNAAWEESINWSTAGEAVWSEKRERDEAQIVNVVAPLGERVQVSAVIASGNVSSHCRTTFKVNGKRATSAVVEEMFKSKVATVENRKRLGALVGM